MSGESLSWLLTWNLNKEKKVYGGRCCLLHFILEKKNFNHANDWFSKEKTYF